jgi:diaminopimelate epimerase
MSAIPFAKMVGTGNDFVVVDTRRRRSDGMKSQWSRISRFACDRHVGVGADGLLVLEPSATAHVRMRVFNPDGSEAQMCGNGARCVARYVTTSSAQRVKIETKAGILEGRVRGDQVAMHMTDPTELRLGLVVDVGSESFRLGVVNTGVPHAVVPVTALDDVDVARVGRALRYHSVFGPRGTNVDFVQPRSGTLTRLRVRTYERGVEGETLACGTGIAASAILHALSADATHLRPEIAGSGQPCSHRIRVQARSGDVLTVSFTVEMTKWGVHVTDVVLEGTARRVFNGILDWPSRSRR